MSAVIKWEDPPASKQRRGGKWAPIADELKANPGKWALVAEDIKHAGTLLAGIKNGKIKAFEPAGAFEATSRSTTDNKTGSRTFNVYARYLQK